MSSIEEEESEKPQKQEKEVKNPQDDEQSTDHNQQTTIPAKKQMYPGAYGVNPYGGRDAYGIGNIYPGQLRRPKMLRHGIKGHFYGQQPEQVKF